MAERLKKVVRVTKSLLLWTLLALGFTVGLFLLAYWQNGQFGLSWFCFGCGVIGGFVSIQQRLKNLAGDDLELLAQSGWAIVTVPIFGGLFALVLYLLVLSGTLQGHAFPKFYVPPFADPSTSQDLLRLFRETRPASGADFAKLGLWSFVAGFSERLVPSFLVARFGDLKGKADGGCPAGDPPGCTKPQDGRETPAPH